MTKQAGRFAALLLPTRKFADAEVSRMLAEAADLFDRRGDHEHASRLRARAAELEQQAEREA